MKRFNCPCEGCKLDRERAKQRREAKKAAAAWHKRQLLDIEGRILASKDAVWPAASGPVRVQEMSSSHLFYALAKARRQEYPGHYEGAVVHLENEAMRRLIARVR